MIPLVDLKAQYRAIKPEVDAAMARVLETTQFILGSEVASFEQEFAAFCGARYAVGVASGTAALHLALRAVGVRPGDEVITTPYTFVATVEAIIWNGARPVLVDIDPGTYNIDPARVEAAVTPRTRAIIPVHLYGQPAEMGPLMALAQHRGIAVIEDAAQAHGAEHHGQRAGSLGTIACFSFYPSKNLGGYGDGGMVTTNDPDLAERVRRLRDHGRSEKYTHIEVGLGERLDALQAAILRAKLPHLEAWTEQRRAAASWYDALLKDVPVACPREAPPAKHVYHLYVVRTPHRDEVLGFLQRQGIGAGVHYPIPVHLQPGYRDLGYRVGDLPHAERAAAEVLSLPLFPEITRGQVETVVATLEEALQSVGVPAGVRG